MLFVNFTCKTFSLPTADWNYSCGANIGGNVARNVHKDPGSAGMDGFQMHPARGSGDQIKGAIHEQTRRPNKNKQAAEEIFNGAEKGKRMCGGEIET